MHTMKEVDMLAAKMDLLMKRLDNQSKEKMDMNEAVQAMDAHMTCEVCGNTGHSGNDCPETQEHVNFINNNNGFQPLQQNQGWNTQSYYQGNGNNFNNFNNHPSLKDLVLGQAKINENISKKLVANDKILENITTKMESLSSAVKNQLSFNKMLET
uniref:CCHC-type domain-containing protein n=1 Tax=Arundo donax TaxID=35708 RepID=A0A0A9C8Z7_ARUDO